MAEDITLPYTNDRYLEMMDQVDRKTLYSPATRTALGTMSAADKRRLDEELPDEPLTNIEIENLLT